MIENILLGILIIMIICFVVFIIYCILEEKAYNKGYTDIRIYEFEMEFTTIDNEVLVHKSGRLYMEGYTPMWNNEHNEYFYASSNKTTYPKHAVKSIRVLPCKYLNVRVSNKNMKRDSFHDEPFFLSCSWVDFDRLVESKMIEITSKKKLDI